jgi:hypothetical protein
MSRRGTWVLLGAAAALIAAIVLLRGPGGPGSSPQHRSDSNAPDGTSALVSYAQALGHPTGTVEGTFTLPQSPALMFVFTPGGFTAAEAQQVSQWVSSGGLLVYAAEEGDPQLDGFFGIQRQRATVAGAATAPAPILGGVKHVDGAGGVFPLKPAALQVPLLRNDRQDTLAVTMRVGSGQVVALADPLELCNGYLGRADNGRFAADLIALAPAGSRVLFDEFHHGSVASSTPLTDWMLTPWGLALLWLVLVVFVGLAARGRAFGPRITIGAPADRSTAEYARAVGDLLRRARARQVTLQTLDAAARRALAQRLGLSLQSDGSRFMETLAQRAPAVARDLQSVESRIGAGADSEASLLAAARQLHTIAYPVAPQPSVKEPS